MKTLIIGGGEVGKALHEVLKEQYYCQTHDPKLGMLALDDFEIMHICIPYSGTFTEEVKQYQAIYRPKHTVIHSTVPVGTSRLCGATHSPIRGLHPNLALGIKIFIKFIGGEGASEVADYFRRAGLRIVLFDKSETTEAGKLFDTEYYRACIEFTHRVKTFCDKNSLNFHEVYTLFNQTYNEGYAVLGYPEYSRPVLQPIMTPVGGHCVVPNSKLINE